ncbi:helix-turn-helix domain-containing protein [Thermaurantiacus tibetensis]|uniref:helix-turn-helix domain-containing protein n=1 Tax=Thermaurantiacus tibetensis TaxID=2759035 RepID=UPI00188F390C|nr:helix-turn-helix transcriptional regulator [Thermaurantiacus tibetensis]
MTSRLRELRKARGLTLAELAARCDPPTTAVTIGRLETGMRRLTLPWMERIAKALDVAPADLLPERSATSLPVAAVLGRDGAQAPSAPLMAPVPVPVAGAIALLVQASAGDYRAGDTLWLEQLPPERFAEAVNTDVLVPRPVGRFAFGRLAAVEAGRLQILPPAPGSRQVVVADPPWIGRAAMLIRRL